MPRTPHVRPATALASFILLALVASCRSPEPPAPEARRTETHRRALISDAVHNSGNRGIYFLPPLVQQPDLQGSFVRQLAPTVRIDELGTTVPPQVVRTVATFATDTGSGLGVVFNSSNHQYHVNWRTADYSLNTQLRYRINVLLDGRVLGTADVQVLGSGSELKNVDTGQYIALLDGKVLPIKFWLGGCAEVVCHASDSCHTAGLCDPQTLACSDPVKPDGASCSDGNACTRTDSCQAGACVGAQPVTCAAKDQCHTAGVCDPSSGVCSNPVKADGSSCSDGNACTRSDVCAAGNCVGNDPVVCASGQCAEPGTCDPQTGTCNQVLKPDDSPCDDANACTREDVCREGTCIGRNPVECTALDTCHSAGVCDPGSGVCSNPPRACGPSIDAGADVTLVAPTNQTILRATVQVADGETAQISWSMVSGPATAVFAAPGSAATEATFPNEGIYVVRVTATTSSGTASDDVVVTVLPCLGLNTPLDVILVLDNSGSMDWENKLRYAKDAAKLFIGNLDFTKDRAGVVSFDTAGVLRSPLSADATALKAAIEAIPSGGGTDVSTGLAKARLEFAANPNPLATKVVVVLSDGESTGDTAAAAAAIDAAGIRAISIGLGSSIDGKQLRLIATSDRDYFYAPSGEDLSWVYSTITQHLCRNRAPLVRAGLDQQSLGVQVPNIITISGEVHDDGPLNDPRLQSTWSQVSGPATVSFISASTPVTDVVFFVPGTYVLRLTATDGLATSSDDVTVLVDPEPSLEGVTLDLTSSHPGPLAIGSTIVLTAKLLGPGGVPVKSYPIEFKLEGANAQTAVDLTDTQGIARFTVVGANAGTDQIGARALTTGTTVVADTLPPFQWVPPSSGGGGSGGGTIVYSQQGWFGSPLHMAVVEGPVPITLGAGITLQTGTIDYWSISAPAQVTTLATGVNGGPGSTLATFDPTTLTNGVYIVRLTGTNDAGLTAGSLIALTVSGEYKPGRMVTSVTDFTVALAGLPISIVRTYDSLDRNRVRDFGYGWSLDIGNPKLEVDPANNVTLTEPSGRRVRFQFTPTSISPWWGFMLAPRYTPEPGVFGTLTSDGCQLLVSSGGRPVCFLGDSLDYSPNSFTYTDPYGRVFSMTSTGTLKSIKDLGDNTITITSSGITSSEGSVNVPFLRDTQGRITQIIGPGARYYKFQYDTAGNLAKTIMPDNTTWTYVYDAGHRLLKAVDPNGNSPAISTFYPDGRLESTADSVGNVTRFAYDLAARTTTTTYPDEGVETVRHDASGLLLERTDPMGAKTSYTYDSRKLKLTETNALGESTRYTYDDKGNETSRTDASGRVWRKSYNAHGQPVTAILPNGQSFAFTYDTNAALKSVVDSQGILSEFTSTRSGLVTSIIDANGARQWMEYDIRGNLIAATDRLGRVNRFTYDSMGRVASTEDARGSSNNFTYSPVGLLTDFRDAAFNLTRLTYDGAGNLKTEQVIVGTTNRTTSYTYDAANRLTDVTQPDGTTKKYSRNFRGQPLTATDELGRITRYEYDRSGRLVKVTFPDSTTRLTTYDSLGRRITETDERGGTTSWEYEPGCNCLDRIVKLTDPLGRVTRHTYDVLGLRSSTTDAAGRVTTFSYDLRGRLTETRSPDGTTIRRTYDDAALKTTLIDAGGAVTEYSYDAEGQLLAVKDPAGQTTRYTYGQTGNLTGITDPLGRFTSLTYDRFNRITQRMTPAGRQESFTYDGFGNLSRRTDANFRSVDFTYDSMNRLLTRKPLSFLSETVTFTYTATGRRASMTDITGVTRYSYDDRDRLSSKETPAGTLSYGYDASGNVVTVKSSNGGGLDAGYTWDAAGQLTGVTDMHLGNKQTIANYGLSGYPVSETRPNGIETTLTRDAQDRVRELLHRSTGPIARYTYSMAPTGHRVSMTDLSGRSVSYGYDAASRLTSETIAGATPADRNGVISYTLNAVGNRTQRTSTVGGIANTTYSYNNDDRLVGDTYDNAGNTTAAAGRTYAYDSENLIKSSNSGAITLGSDGDGNRTRKTVGGVTTLYLVDDLNPTGLPQVVEEVVGGVTQNVYTWGSLLISQSQRKGDVWSTTYYGYDAQGNITFLTDENGAITDRYVYDAFGNLLTSSGTTSNVYLYGGQRWDSDLGLYYLRARYYDPNRGRFMSRDPFAGMPALPASLHKYQYAHGDPVNLGDPSGLTVALEYRVSMGAAVIPLLAPTQTSLGWDGGSITVNTFVAHALGLQVACILVGAANGLANMTRAQFGLTSNSPPAPYTYCRFRFAPRAIDWGKGGRPNRCGAAEFARLNDAVNRLCHAFPPPGCHEGMSCREAAAALAANEACLAARKAREWRCFNGGDQGHGEQIEARENAVNNCIRVLSKVCKGRLPDRSPIPLPFPR